MRRARVHAPCRNKACVPASRQERVGEEEAPRAGAWFHSGDLGMKHKRGTIQFKDRS
jgi:hypothetical protein